VAQFFAWLGSLRGSALCVARLFAWLGSLRGSVPCVARYPAWRYLLGWRFSGKVAVSGVACLAPLTRLDVACVGFGAGRSRRACSWVCCESYRVAGSFGLSAVLVVDGSGCVWFWQMAFGLSAHRLPMILTDSAPPPPRSPTTVAADERSMSAISACRSESIRLLNHVCPSPGPRSSPKSFLAIAPGGTAQRFSLRHRESFT